MYQICTITPTSSELSISDNGDAKITCRQIALDYCATDRRLNEHYELRADQCTSSFVTAISTTHCRSKSHL